MFDKRELIIIGAGPSGLTASIYASRYGLNVLVLGANHGGTITDAHKVCNFPGYPEIPGPKLGLKIKKHAIKEGVDLKMEKVDRLKKKEQNFLLETNLGGKYSTKNLIVATGTKRRKLGLNRENDFLGSGVSYCATCDGKFFENQKVGVIGGGNAATTAALYLSELAEKVYLIYRGNKLKAVKSWQNKIVKQDNLEVIYGTEVERLNGNNHLESVNLSQSYNGSKKLDLEGLFIEIGSVPNVDIFNQLELTKDDKGYIKVDNEQKTSVESVWAAGDVTTNSNYFKQAVVSSGEGAVAANSVYKEIKG